MTLTRARTRVPLPAVGVRLAWLASAAIVATVGCSTPPRVTFWERFGPFDLEVERYNTLAEMANASDAVVVARVEQIGEPRVIQGDAAADRVTYIAVHVRILRWLRGDTPGIVPLEFLGGTPEKAEAAVRELRAAMPKEPFVVFLHEKRGAGEAGLYRPTNSAGLWAASTRSPLDTPLAEATPQESGVYAGELAGITSIDGLINLLDGGTDG